MITVMKKALMMAHVASMIDLFNMDNIHILQKMGYEVDVACNFEHGSVTTKLRVEQFKKQLDEENIRSYHIPVPRRITAVNDIIASYNIIHNLINENQYEIVHCQSPIGGVIARLACRTARKNGTKIIYVAHGFHFYKGAPLKNWMLYYPIEKLCSKYTDCLITMNQEDYSLALKKMIYANEVTYIPGVGIDTKAISEMNVDITKKRLELNIPVKATVIVSVGELNDNKNHEIMIKALGAIQNPDIYYIICGQGMLLTHLSMLCEQYNLGDHVKFLGFRNDVIPILKASDIFAFPSKREGLSVSLMEAMACGLPVISSNIRGNTDLIVEGKGGYLVNPNQVEDFVHAIKKLMSNKELCDQMRCFNLEIIKEKDKKNINKIMESIYQIS